MWAELEKLIMLPLSKHYSIEGYNYNGKYFRILHGGRITYRLYLSAYPSFWLSLCLSFYLSGCVCLFGCVFVCLSGCLLVYYFYLSMLTLAHYLIDWLFIMYSLLSMPCETVQFIASWLTKNNFLTHSKALTTWLTDWLTNSLIHSMTNWLLDSTPCTCIHFNLFQFYILKNVWLMLYS